MALSRLKLEGNTVRWTERAVALAGAVLLLCCGLIGLRAKVYARTAQQANIETEIAGASATHVPGRTAEGILGSLEIPALSLAVAVLPDFDSPSLLKGVGHIQGTAMPGGLGTVGLAGHRDTFFRPLRRIARGMEIDLSDATGRYRYTVDRTEIVTPEQVSVLAITDRPEMVLVTCYPFDFLGAAPKRFIVHAHLISLLPEHAKG